MSNNEMFFAILGVVTLGISAQYKVIKDYLDARFNSIDKKLDFLLEHFADH